MFIFSEGDFAYLFSISYLRKILLCIYYALYTGETKARHSLYPLFLPIHHKL